MRLKFYLLRKFVRSKYKGPAYVSKNSGKLYWITGKRDPKRSTKFVIWQNWTLYCGSEQIGVYPFLVEAKHQAQVHYTISETAN